MPGKSKSLAYRIAEKLIAKKQLSGNPEDWKIERTRVGRHQLSAGSYRFLLINRDDELLAFGCHATASVAVRKDIFVADDGWPHEAYIEYDD